MVVGIRLYIVFGISPQVDDNGWTPLHHAVQATVYLKEAVRAVRGLVPMMTLDRLRAKTAEGRPKGWQALNMCAYNSDVARQRCSLCKLLLNARAEVFALRVLYSWRCISVAYHLRITDCVLYCVILSAVYVSDMVRENMLYYCILRMLRIAFIVHGVFVHCMLYIDTHSLSTVCFIVIVLLYLA